MSNGYWWECESCKEKTSFRDTVGVEIAAFIWDTLSNDWDQTLLLRECSRCKGRRLRITFNFPRQNRSVFRVKHIIGTFITNSYLAMMWEFYEIGNPNLSKYDFTYLTGRNPYGLKSPAIISSEELKELFNLYRNKTEQNTFP